MHVYIAYNYDSHMQIGNLTTTYLPGNIYCYDPKTIRVLLYFKVIYLFLRYVTLRYVTKMWKITRMA